MTIEQVLELLTVIKVSFPNFYKNVSNEEFHITVNVWFQILKEYDSIIIFLVLKDIIKSHKYPPTIADLIEYYNESLKLKEWKEKIQRFNLLEATK